MTDAPEPRRISLLESLDEGWLKLPLAIMQDVGPAVQTLSGLLKVTHRETFSPVSDISAAARVPVATVRKHLVILDQAGWIVHAGREETRGGHLRRTATIKIPKTTIEKSEPYGILPWWACCSIRKVGRLPWSARAVLSVVMARLCSLKATADRQGLADGDGTQEELQDAVDVLGGTERWRFSLAWLTRQTGLDHKSIVTAKAFLNHNCGIVTWEGDTRARPGANIEADVLEPNWGFTVLEIPASEGKCFLEFKG